MTPSPAETPKSGGPAAERMSKQRRVDTAPELALRRALHARGLRYRVAFPVPGRPRRSMDVGFTRARVAVFVDGCFWHACPVHATKPKENGAWWQAKLAANVARDRDTDTVLGGQGWVVVRVWEHETVHEAADRIVAELDRRDR